MSSTAPAMVVPSPVLPDEAITFLPQQEDTKPTNEDNSPKDAKDDINGVIVVVFKKKKARSMSTRGKHLELGWFIH